MASAAFAPLNGSNEGSSMGAKVGWMLGGGAIGLIVGAGAMFGLDQAKAPVAALPESLGNPSSEDVLCGTPESFQFQHVSSIDPGAKEAIDHSFMLMDLSREQCSDSEFPVQPLGYRPSDFESGVEGGPSVQVHHKFASTCHDETYKLHFSIPAAGKDGKETSIVVELSHDREGDTWKLLGSDPTPCEIADGEAAAPETQTTDSPIVKNAVKFIEAEMGYQMKHKGCLASDGSVKVKEVLSAETSILSGVQTKLLVLLSAGTDDTTLEHPTAAELIVAENCNEIKGGECQKSLEVTGDESKNICKLLESPKPLEEHEAHRRLQERKTRLGHISPDRTEVEVARRANLELRHLGQVQGRGAITYRQIRSNSKIPDEYDPRESECYKHMPIYDQGSCGSCYAQAVAVMVGVRNCLHAKGMPQARLLKEVGTPKLPSNSSRSASLKVKRQLSDTGCRDSSIWTDVAGDGCDWYGEHDPKCRKYSDYGQLTHCQKTCGICAEELAEDEAESNNPWKQAWYQYMPSAGAMAQCDNHNGNPRGCDGGSAWGIWNYYMKDLDSSLSVMGESCDPYNLKCWSSSGVVNPLVGSGSCGSFTDFQLWHKPCDCIPNSRRPSSYQCPTAPKASCSIDVPSAMFMVSGPSNGLSIAATVQNIQRHLVEYGPLYMSFDCHSKFSAWDWEKHPVYTGGGTHNGGHAIVGVGWGTHKGTDYWLLRNSWGAGWGDEGYFKFQRGVNLDNIESDTAYASMPTEDYKDWSAPDCDWQSSKSWSWSGSKLTIYSQYFFVTCDKKAIVKLYLNSAGSEDLKLVESRKYDGSRIKFEYPLQCNGYGLTASPMKVKMVYEDINGNSASSQHTMTVQPVSRMYSVSHQYC